MSLINRIYNRLLNLRQHNVNPGEEIQPEGVGTKNPDSPTERPAPKQPKRSIETLEEAIQNLAAEARNVAELGFESFDFNSQGDYVDAPERLYWETLAHVNEIALRFRKTQWNNSFLGHALLNLADYISVDEKESVLRQAIFHFEESNRINPQGDCIRLMGRCYFELGEHLDGKASNEAYSKAESSFKTCLNEGHKQKWLYSEIGRSICYQADDLIGPEDKETRRKEGISYLQQAVRLNQKDPWEQFYLGEELANLAEETLDTERKTRLYTHALRHVQRSYDLDKDPIALELIQEIKDAIA